MPEATTYDRDQLCQFFVKAGLSATTAANTASNKKTAAILVDLLERSGYLDKDAPCASFAQGLVALTKAAPFDKGLYPAHLSNLLNAIAIGDLKSNLQVVAAMKYFSTEANFDQTAFNAASGVGVVVTDAEIDQVIDQTFATNAEQLQTERYQLFGKLLGDINTTLPWADKKLVKEKYDAKFLAVCGEKTANDNVNKGQLAQQKREKEEQTRVAKKQTSPTAATTATTPENANGEETPDEDFIIPDDDYLNGRQLEWAQNTPEQLQGHNNRTGGRVITRFPPEPNGYLHIGHAKAMVQNFGVADKFNGHCIMRFDDTNPDAEDQEYIDMILENLKELGHTPWKITFSSDYFQELYDFAVQLIKTDKAYVCHQTKDEIKADREVAKKTGGPVPPSPYRSRTIDENLLLFDNMKRGLCAENECTLRMKGDLTSPNPNMWDTVFYRVRYSPHPHAGTKWCIYPTYDFTHCIIDSLEDVTFSMCTLEFEIRRESYFWLLHELNLYKPKVWEFSRLNITHNVLSKRRLRSLVMDKHVNGWDDPRLLTINGLFRRGFTGPIINKFIKSIGISRSATLVPIERLYGVARELLNPITPRVMAVVTPLKIILRNFDTTTIHQYSHPQLPTSQPSDEQHPITLTNTVYIEREDFWDEKLQGPVPAGYKRLTLQGRVHLRYTMYYMQAVEVVYTANGEIDHVVCDATAVNNPKEIKKNPVIHFVSQSLPGVEPLKAEFRLYNELFLSDEPMGIKEWEKDINPESLVVQYGYIDPYTAQIAQKDGKQFQFERVGYFIVDKDSTFNLEAPNQSKLVFNRTCELRSKTPL